MKAATALASSGSSQMASSRVVADESRMDVEGEERDESQKFDRGEHKAKNFDENIMGKEQKR